MEWTLTLAPQTWLFGLFFLLAGGKLLQQGGRSYGEGKNWEVDTIMGLACQVAIILVVALSLISQNAQ